LIHCETAFEMWEKLVSINEQKSEASLHLLQQKLFSYSRENEIKTVKNKYCRYPSPKNIKVLLSYLTVIFNITKTNFHKKY